MFYTILLLNCVICILDVSKIDNKLRMYIYMHTFFSREPVVKYFPSHYCLRSIYIKRDLTVQNSTC